MSFFKPNSFFIDKNSCQRVKKSAIMSLLVAKSHFERMQAFQNVTKFTFPNSNLAFGVNFKSCRVRGPIPSSLSYFNLEFLILVFGHIPSLYHISFIFRLKISAYKQRAMTNIN